MPVSRFGKWALGVVVTLAAVASGWAAAPAAPPAQPTSGRSLEPPGGTLIAAGAAPDLILIASGDVIGYLEPCG